MAKREETNPLIAAVRKLRIGMGDTQQQFADRLGLAIATVVRYEHNRVPRGKALSRLEVAASANGFDDYADLFRMALRAELGGPPPRPEQRTFTLRDGEEQDLVRALLYSLREEGPNTKRAKAIRRVLKPLVEERRRFEEEKEALKAQQTAIFGLMENGRTAEDVMQVFRTNAEAVGDAYFRQGGVTIIEERMCEVVELLLKNGWSIKKMAERFGFGEANDFLDCARTLGNFKAIHDYEVELGKEANDNA